jgi:hypothetical protein
MESIANKEVIVKKVLVLLALLLATAIGAQTSLYDMQYGDGVTATLARLKAKGFVESSREDGLFTYKGAKDPNLPTIYIYLSPDRESVNGWKMEYDLKAKPELATQILASLVALHGKSSVYDDYDY